MARYAICGNIQDFGDETAEQAALVMMPLDGFDIVKMSDEDFERQFGSKRGWSYGKCGDKVPSTPCGVAFEGEGTSVTYEQLQPQLEKLNWDELATKK